MGNDPLRLEVCQSIYINIKLHFNRMDSRSRRAQRSVLFIFGFGHRQDNIRLLKCTFVVFYLFIYYFCLFRMY